MKFIEIDFFLRPSNPMTVYFYFPVYRPQVSCCLKQLSSALYVLLECFSVCFLNGALQTVLSEGLKNSRTSLEAFLPPSFRVQLEEARAGWWAHLECGGRRVPCASLSPLVPV